MGVLHRGQFVCAREGESGNPQLEHLIVINSHFLYWPNDHHYFQRITSKQVSLDLLNGLLDASLTEAIGTTTMIVRASYDESAVTRLVSNRLPLYPLGSCQVR